MQPYIYKIIEIIGAVTGLLAVYLNSKRNSSAWLLGLIGIVTSGVVFFQSGLYAEMGLQVVFGISSIYGFVQWKVYGDIEKKLNPTYTSGVFRFLYFLLLLIFFAAIYFILINFTNSTTPLPDAAITSIGLVAQIMLAKQQQENWYLWTMANLMSVPLFIHKEIYIYALLYFGYLLLGLYGLYVWHRKLHASSLK